VDARGYRLGVDFGTSNTVAMLAWPDGHVRPLLFDGSPALPSAVYADPSAGLLIGRDAAHAARVSPERFEPNPKRRIDEPGVLLGETEIGIVDLIAAVLGRVGAEARRVAGGRPIGPATVTYPAAWAQTRRGILVAAAERAGLGAVSLVPEPVAAASVFVALSDTTVRPGSAFVVYDLGAGTFDASVVRRVGGGFEVLSTEGLSQSGGLDIDAAIVGYLGAVYSARDPALWGRLRRPTTSAERRAARLLWEDVRAAKEMLSRASTTMIHIPLADEDAPLGRDQFEQLARPILDGTVTATRAAIASAGVAPAGIFLVGGGSRIPLVATLLHQAFGIAPTVVEQPELVVAQGSLGAVDALGPAAMSAGPATMPGPVSPPSGVYGSAAVPPGASPGSPGGPVAASSGPVSAPPGGPVSAVPGAPVSGLPGPVSAPSAGVYGSASVPPGPVSAPPGGPVSGPPGRPMPPAAWAGAAPSSGGAPVPGGPGYGASGPGTAGRAAMAGPPAGGAAVGPGGAPPHPGYPGQSPPSQGRKRGILVAVALVVLLALGGGAYAVSRLGGDDNSGGGDTSSQNTGTDTGSDSGTDNGGENGGDTGDNGGQGTGGQPTADAVHPDVDWTSSASEYDGLTDKTIAYNCPANGTIGTVWGSEPYTTDSSVCTAAVHAGRISLEDGGWVVIQIREGDQSYQGSLQHGINTTAYGPYEWAFSFAG
jgi:Ethanolamine utilization protein EutJ (predicted chaperonin)